MVWQADESDRAKPDRSVGARVVESSVEQSGHLNCDATAGEDTSELGSKEVLS